MASIRLSIIIAVQHARENLPDIIRQLYFPGHEGVEYLFCYTDADPGIETCVSKSDHVHLIKSPSGSLIPHLWRDGILAARGQYVAITTAHCIPSDDWVDNLLSLDMSDKVGAGGVIDNDQGSDSMGWAIFFQRYIAFASPQVLHMANEIAADNAIYCRADVVSHGDLMERGFWEPSFHARFRTAGLQMYIAPCLRVVHKNRYSASQYFKQRYAHGREFGLARAHSLGIMKQLILIVLSPVLPVVFLRKIILAAGKNKQYVSQLPRALPWLLLFLIAWGTGEASGYLSSLYRTS